MAWNRYPVPCECGVVHQVSAGDAGVTLACACGKSVEVPSLVKLKASVGQAAVSADFELDQLIGTSALPVEDKCLACGCRTDHKRHVTVVCERQGEKKEHTTAGSIVSRLLVAFVTFGFLRYHPGDGPGQAVGRDVAYRLPIRVCESCGARPWSKEEVRAALERTPVYARLFDKYPHATVGPLA